MQKPAQLYSSKAKTRRQGKQNGEKEKATHACIAL
jgi:hypothetical protein